MDRTIILEDFDRCVLKIPLSFKIDEILKILHELKEIFPEIFAEGAAMGTPHCSIKLLAISLLGILIATVSSPQLTTSGIISFFFITTVSGPGQK